VVEEAVLAHHRREGTMNLQTDIYRATPPAAVATVPRRRRRTAFVAVSLVALLAIGVGVAVAQIADGGSRSVAQPTPPRLR
jgi:hypothetical protein